VFKVGAFADDGTDDDADALLSGRRDAPVTETSFYCLLPVLGSASISKLLQKKNHMGRLSL
jgi:hypothetical protein